MTTRIELNGDVYEVDISGDSLRGVRLAPIIEGSEEVTTLQAAEDAAIVRALRHARGNRSLAAKWLGVDRRTLYRKLPRLLALLKEPV